MIDDVISATMSILIALAVALPLGEQVKRHPLVFYGVAAAAVAGYLCYRFNHLYVPQVQHLVDMMQKGYLSCSFLAIVMFVGVLPETSSARKRLQPIRAELSIISFELILAHVLAFLPSYLPRLGSMMSSHTSLMVSFLVAAVLTLQFAVLAAFSLKVFRTKMPYKTWKAIQRSAYVMVALLYLHILMALGRSVFVGRGSGAAAFALGVYTVIVIAYAVLRLLKMRRDKAHRAASRA